MPTKPTTEEVVNLNTKRIAGLDTRLGKLEKDHQAMIRDLMGEGGPEAFIQRLVANMMTGVVTELNKRLDQTEKDVLGTETKRACPNCKAEMESIGVKADENSPTGYMQVWKCPACSSVTDRFVTPQSRPIRQEKEGGEGSG